MKNDLPQTPPSRLRKVISAITVVSYMVMSIGQSYAMDNPTVGPEGYSKGRKLSQVGVDPTVNLSDALEKGEGGSVELTSRAGDSKLPVGANTSVVIKDPTLKDEEADVVEDALPTVPKISDKEKEGLDKLNAYFKDRFSAAKTEHSKRQEKMKVSLVVSAIAEIYGEYLLLTNDTLYSMELTDAGFRYIDMEPEHEGDITLIKDFMLVNAVLSLTPYVISRLSLFTETFYPSKERQSIQEEESLFAKALWGTPILAASGVAGASPALSVYGAYIGFYDTKILAEIFPEFLAWFYGLDALLRYSLFKNNEARKVTDDIWARALSRYYKDPKFREEFKKTSEERHHVRGVIRAAKDEISSMNNDEFFAFKDKFLSLGQTSPASNDEENTDVSLPHYQTLLVLGNYQEVAPPPSLVESLSYKSIKASMSASAKSFKESVESLKETTIDVDQTKKWFSKNWFKVIVSAFALALAGGAWNYTYQGYEGTLETSSVALAGNAKNLGTPAQQAVNRENFKIFNEDTASYVENADIYNGNGTDWCTPCFAKPSFASGNKKDGGVFYLKGTCPGVPYNSKLTSDPGNFDYTPDNCYGLYYTIYYTVADLGGIVLNNNGTVISTSGFKLHVPKVGRSVAQGFGGVGATIVSLYGAAAAKNGLKIIAESSLTNPASVSNAVIQSFVRASSAGFKYFTDQKILGRNIDSWGYLTITAITTLAALNYFGDFFDVYRRVPNNLKKMWRNIEKEYYKSRKIPFEQKRHRSIEEMELMDRLGEVEGDTHTMRPELIKILDGLRKDHGMAQSLV